MNQCNLSFFIYSQENDNLQKKRVYVFPKLLEKDFKNEDINFQQLFNLNVTSTSCKVEISFGIISSKELCKLFFTK